MFKKEFQKSPADLWIEKLLGETGTPGDGVKPELFDMSFVYNP